MLIAQNGKALAAIDVEKNAPEPLKYAAGELVKFLRRRTGATLPYRNGAGRRIVLRTAPQAAAEYAAELAGAPAESYIVAAAECIYLVGKDELGTVFAVFDFLATEVDIGFGGLGDEGVRCALTPVLDVTVKRRLVSPELAYRGLQGGLYEDAVERAGGISDLHVKRLDWMVQNRMNFYLLYPAAKFNNVENDFFNIERLLPEVKRRGLKVQVGGHFFALLLPPDKYFDAHPEYFPLKNGQRTKNIRDMQLCFCTSNPEVAKAVAAEVTAFLDRHPDVDVFSLWQEDGTGSCECDDCRKLSDLPSGWSYDLIRNHADDPLETIDTNVSRPIEPSDTFPGQDRHIPRSCRDRKKTVRYALFVNAVARHVAKTHPQVLLTAAFYHDMDAPPEGVTLEPNVQPVLCHYIRCGHHRLDDPSCGENAYYYRITREWASLYPGRLVVYDYLMGTSGYASLPWPLVPTMHHDWKEMKKLGVLGATIQSQASHFTVYGPTYSAFARMAWNLNASTEAIAKPYYTDLYEEAAEPLWAAARLLEKKMADDDPAPDELREFVAPYYSGFMPEIYRRHFPRCIYPGPNHFAKFMDEKAMKRLRELVEQAKSLCRQDRTRRNVGKYETALGYWELAFSLFRRLAVLRMKIRDEGRLEKDDVEDCLRRYGEIVRYIDRIAEPDVVAKGMLMYEGWGASWPRLYKHFLDVMKAGTFAGKELQANPFWP